MIRPRVVSVEADAGARVAAQIYASDQEAGAAASMPPR